MEVGSTRGAEIVIESDVKTAADSTTRALDAQDNIYQDSPFYAPHGWRGLTVRALFLLLTIGLLIISILSLSPWSVTHYSATTFSISVFYIIFTGVTVILLVVYNLLGKSATTIIPCVCDGWYKIYTCALYLVMLILITIAALNTRRTPCGRYTSFSPDHDVYSVLCGSSTYVEEAHSLGVDMPYQNGSAAHVNLASPLVYDSYGLATVVESGLIAVQGFDGWCELISLNNTIELFERFSQPS
jgi:hypothetical protein